MHCWTWGRTCGSAILMAAIGLSVGCGEEADPYGEACADADGDGVFSGCEMYDTATPGPDCNDDATDPHAADNWESCDQCVDADGDGVFVGCDQYEVIEGPDCSDVAGDVFSAANWEQCETCVDADGDGAYAGCDAYSEDGTGLWEDEDDSTFELLILVEEGLDVSLRESLDVYRADLRAQGLDSRVDVWTSGSVESLRETLQEMERNWSIDGVFLVGDLPAAWYQAYNFGEYEEFPTDIFLQAFSVHWTDNNGDGRYDAHSTMTGMGFGLDLYLSRLTGDVSEMQSYFERVHTYKTEGPLLDPSMFIFIDEDWQHPAYGFVGQTWGLHPIYSSFVRMEDPASTTRDAYLNRMTTLGGEYVYQWIHSSPTELYIARNGGYEMVSVDTITAYGAVGSFFNLFDCSAARFTEENLASTYLHQPYGLATVGSTKPGGIYSPQSFHAELVAGGNWGQGFVRWYETVGRYDDSWFLGMGIQGDPTLTLSADTRRSMQETAGPAVEWTEEMRENLMRSLLEGPGDAGGSYADYRATHPRFFDRPE